MSHGALLRYRMGEQQRTSPPAASLTPLQLALIGNALRRDPVCAINTVAVPWTFVFNGTADGAPLAGCEGTCCPDVRDIWVSCVIAGIPTGTSFLVMTGDSKPPEWWPRSLPVVVGNRLVDGPGIVLPTSSERWYGEVAIGPRRHGLEWSRRRSALFWRGDASGFEPGMSMQRAVFVRALRERGHNVSFTQFPHSLENYRSLYRVQRSPDGSVRSLFSILLNRTVTLR